jgi:hypothetical protein
MEDADVLENAEPPEDEKPEPRRRYHAMTELGQRALLAETERLESLVAYVRRRELGSRAKAV